MPHSEPLVRVLRGGVEESLHTGALVLLEVDRGGRERVVVARGDPKRLVFYRSASKPLQALELVLCGAAEQFGLTDAEVAIAAGSHNGEPRHLATVRSMLAKAGVPEGALQCGGHRSINADVAFAQRRDGVPVTSILSNCSGKHAGMLAASKHRGAPLEGYLDLAHPVQAAIVRHVASFAGIEPDRVFAGVDGCGAPALAVPLDAMARSIARFGAPDRVDDGPPSRAGHATPADGMPVVSLADGLAEAAKRVASAMGKHPEMVAGDERFDTDLMVAGKGALIAKAGAEGVHVVAVPARGLGLAVKVDDGSDRGYRAVVVELLRRHGVLTDAAADALRARHAAAIVPNMAGKPVGRLEVAF